MDNTDTSHDDDDEDEDDDDTDDPSQRSVWVLGASPTQLESFQDDVQYLWAPFVDSSTSTSTTTTTTIPIYETPPSSLNFLRNHVAVSRPCIIRNSILVPTVDTTVDVDTDTDDTGVVPLHLTLDDLVQRFPDNHNVDVDGDDNDDDKKASSSPLPLLTVDVTPDGHGDCLRKVAVAVPGIDDDDDDDDDKNDEVCRKKEVIQQVFVKPLEQEMSLSTFRHHLRQGRHKQQQQKQHEGGRGGRRRRRNKDTISSRVFVEEEALLTTDKRKDEDTVDVEGDGTATATDPDTDFLDDCVLYYSRQNDCLREELLPLWNAKVNLSSSSSSSSLDGNKKNETGHQYLFPRSFPWAEEAFFGQPPQQPMDTTTATTTNQGRGPEACNIWIGDERVVSSMHKDYYENLFYVASGEKVFHLCPPSDIPFLYEQEVTSGRFQFHQSHPVDSDEDDDDDDDDDDDGAPTPRRTRRWTVALDREEEEDPGEDIVGTATTTSSNEHEHEVSTSNEKKKKYSKVHWIAADPFACRKNNDEDFDDHDDTEEEEEQDHQRERTTEVTASLSSSSLYPLSHYAHPITVTVQAGELLYLPSLWFHRVTQTCETIGINYWYDMNFESPLYCYFHFLQQLHTTTSTSTTTTSTSK